MGVGRDSSVGIAISYEPDGLKIEYRWGRDLRTRPDRPWGPLNLLCNWYLFPFPGLKRPEHGVDNSPPTGAEVKERVELYFYSPYAPSWLVLVWILPLLLPLSTYEQIWHLLFCWID